MTDLERVVQEADQASVELHAAMLKMDMRLGLLKQAVDERNLADFERSVLSLVPGADAFAGGRDDRMGAIA